VDAYGLVNDRGAGHRNGNHGLAGRLHPLLDRGGNFPGFPIADSNLSIPIANDDEGAEAEALGAFGHLGDPIDVDYALFELRLCH
jgi:hypothetical protein